MQHTGAALSLIDATSVGDGASQPSEQCGVANMVNLLPLNLDTLLANIKLRYQHNLIYTYIGVGSLIAVNPYQVLPIYTPQIVRSYFGVAFGELEPHVFALADYALMQLMEEKQNQSIIISGESGSGKTENAKLVLQYLAMRTKSIGGAADLSTASNSVEQKILQASPVLEAFGNARTVRNNNSSRFGKFIEVVLNGHLQIEGAVIHQYLLEKSRIVKQAAGERNYHIFYELCFSEDPVLISSLSLSHPKAFNYTNQSKVYGLGENDVSDTVSFSRVRDAMTFLGITLAEQQAVFRATAAVLHLGNLDFVEGPNDSSKVLNPERLRIICGLLGVPPAKLEEACTFRYNVIRGETFKVPLRVAQAVEARDSIAKALYSGVFNWLVEVINCCLMSEKMTQKNRQFIGVLDIFGFENFKENSFEQLCINYANERLQQLFTQFLFKQEQAEYKNENIVNWQEVQFKDNQGCVDLVEKKPNGIMSVLDEESRFPNATDLTFVNKLFTMASKDFGAYLFKTKVKADERFVFGINHYAGPVEYRAQGFLAKNRDTIPELFVKLMRQSEEPIFSEFFGDDGGGDSLDDAIGSAPPMTPKLDRQSQDGGSGEARDLTARRGDSPFPGVRLHDSVSSEVDGTPRTPGSPSSARRRISSSYFSSSPLLPTGDAKKEGKKSLCVQFKDSLVALCTLLASTNAHYIRCVKPNVSFQPNVFLEEMVSNQLQYSGIVETIRVRLEGFPSRRGLKNFCDVFMMIDLSKRVKGNLKESARALLTDLDPQVQKTHWMIGDAKVFLKDPAFNALQELRRVACVGYAKKLQAYWRMYSQRRSYRKLRAASIVFQALTRMAVQRWRYERICDSALVFQSFVRQWFLRRVFVAKKAKIARVQALARMVLSARQLNRTLQLQRVCRMFIARARFLKKRKLALLIQRSVRGRVARQQLAEMVAKLNKEEQERMQAQERARQEAERMEAERREKLRSEEEEQAQVAKKKQQEVEEEKAEAAAAAAAAVVAAEKDEQVARKEESVDVGGDEVMKAVGASSVVVSAPKRQTVVAPDASALPDDSSAYIAGEVVLALNSATFAWERAIVNEKTPNGSYIVTFQASRVQTETFADGIRPLVDGKVRARVMLKTVAETGQELREGDVVEAVYRGDQGWYSGRVVSADPSARAYRIAWQDPSGKDGDAQDTDVSAIRVPDLVSQNREKFVVGDECEAQYTQDKRWYAAEIRYVDPLAHVFVVHFTAFDRQQQCTAGQVRLKRSQYADEEASVREEQRLQESFAAASKGKKIVKGVVLESNGLPAKAISDQKAVAARFRYNIPEAVLPSDVAQFKFPAFSKAHFRKEALTAERMFTIRATIRRRGHGSLLELPEDLAAKAASIFENVTLYAKKGSQGSGASGGSGGALATGFAAAASQSQTVVGSLLTEAILNPALRDEVYCRLIHQQIGAMPSTLYWVRLWELMCCAAIAFRPSPELELYVLNHCRISQQDQRAPEEVRRLASVCLRLLLRARAMESNRRMLPLYDFEIRRVLDGEQLTVVVVFPEGNKKKLIVDSATTFGEVTNVLCEKMDVSDASKFAVYKSFGVWESAAAPSENVCDTIAWAEGLRRAKGFKAPFELLFRKRIFLPTELPEAVSEAGIVFPQAVYGFRSGSLRASTDDMVVLLAALLLQYESGDWTSSRRIVQELDRVVPLVALKSSQLGATDWESLILKQYEKLAGLPKPAVIARFMAEVRRLPLFGATAFAHCKYVHCSRRSLKLSTSMTLSVSHRGVQLLNDESGALLLECPFVRIADWSWKDGNMFYVSCIGAGSEPLASSVLFDVALQTQQAEEICTLLHDYAVSLLQSSTAAVAVKSVGASKSPEMLSFPKGSVIYVTDKGATGWFYGTLLVDGRAGYFPAEAVAFLFEFPEVGQDVFSKSIMLPNIQKPADAFVSVELRNTRSGLESYAASEFVDPKACSFVSVPIESPLHRFSHLTDSVFATDMFMRVMKWMGDYPVGATNLYQAVFMDMVQKAMVSVAVDASAGQSAAVLVSAKAAATAVSSKGNNSAASTGSRASKRTSRNLSSASSDDVASSKPVGSETVSSSSAASTSAPAPAAEIRAKEATLLDELYCQVWRQLIGNPNAASVRRGLELLAVLVGVAKPRSLGLLKPLQAFVKSLIGTRGGVDDVLISYILSSLGEQKAESESDGRSAQQESLQRRRYAASVKEVVSSMRGERVAILVSVGRRDVVVHVTPMSKVTALLEGVLKELGLRGHASEYAIVLGTDGPLSNDAFVCDVLTHWSRSPENRALFASVDLDALLELPNIDVELRAYQPRLGLCKLVVQPSMSSLDAKLLDVLVDQIVVDVASGDLFFPVDGDLCEAVALVGRIFDGTVLVQPHSNLYGDDFLSQRATEISTHSDAVSQLSVEQAKKQLLHVAARSPVFGHVMYVLASVTHKRPQGVKLYLSSTTVVVASVDSREIFNSWSLPEIARVSATPSSFKISYGNLVREEEVVFTTYLGQQIKTVFETFVRIAKNSK